MIKRMLIAAVAVGIIVNFLADLNVLHQSNYSVSTGQWVFHKYEVTKSIDAAKISILQSQLKKKTIPQVREQFKKLGNLVQDTPPQQILSQRLLKLSDHDLTITHHNPAIDILSQMSAAESSLLTAGLNEDSKANGDSIDKALFANSIDVLLIFLFIWFFFYERRNALKLQTAISKTLVQVETTNQQLQLAIINSDAKFKTIVHNLKNPLGSIRGFAELIYDEAANKDSVIEMANIIQRVSNSTLTLVGTVLQESSIETQPKELLRLSDCLNDVCLFLDPLAKEKKQNIKIKNDCPEFYLWGHRQQVQDIFFNLISNAIKFSPKGSQISVTSATSGAFNEIQIIDQGPGFSKDDFSKLFIVQAKLSAKPTGNESSTGFGLYSAKLAIERLNGTIAATNNVDHGACICVRFPMTGATPAKDLRLLES
jgi:signal transduction histidine kinase